MQREIKPLKVKVKGKLVKTDITGLEMNGIMYCSYRKLYIPILAQGKLCKQIIAKAIEGEVEITGKLVNSAADYNLYVQVEEVL